MVKKNDYEVGQSSASPPPPFIPLIPLVSCSEAIVGWNLEHDCCNTSDVYAGHYIQGLPADARVSLLK